MESIDVDTLTTRKGLLQIHGAPLTNFLYQHGG